MAMAFYIEFTQHFSYRNMCGKWGEVDPEVHHLYSMSGIPEKYFCKGGAHFFLLKKSQRASGF